MSYTSQQQVVPPIPPIPPFPPVLPTVGVVITDFTDPRLWSLVRHLNCLTAWVGTQFDIRSGVAAKTVNTQTVAGLMSNFILMPEHAAPLPSACDISFRARFTNYEHPGAGVAGGDGPAGFGFQLPRTAQQESPTAPLLRVNPAIPAQVIGSANDYPTWESVINAQAITASMAAPAINFDVITALGFDPAAAPGRYAYTYFGVAIDGGAPVAVPLNVGRFYSLRYAWGLRVFIGYVSTAVYLAHGARIAEFELLQGRAYLM